MKKRVLVGMSWWVDSAVTAYLLLQQGYDVIAWFMKNYADENNPDCHTRQDRNMAVKVSQHLWITTFVIFDFRQAYHDTIIQYIYDSYHQGLTPNPDILCNTEVKFKLFLEEWIKLWCDYVATGHYVRKQEKNWIYTLHKGIDTNKDQSYFLSWLNQQQLSKSLFPLGELTKPEVRAIATQASLPNAERKDSQWLCFIGKVDMKSFLQETLPTTIGDIVDTAWKVLGQHEGAWFYTIGQRQWLWLAWGPWYVLHKDVTTNQLIVWPKEAQDLFHTQLITGERHRIGQQKKLPLSAHAKIRYRQQDQACTIQPHTQDEFLVTFTQAQRAISPGQTIALYDNDELIASAIIKQAL